MPNYCDFTLKAVGSMQGILELSKFLCYEYYYDDKKGIYPYEHHFWRIIDCTKASENKLEALDDGNYSFIFNGYCAWSCLSCMFDGPLTYQGENKHNPNNMGITLPEASKMLGLDVELWSFEPGCAFQEHYLIKQGETLISDCINDVYEISIANYLDDEDYYNGTGMIDMLCNEKGISHCDVKSYLERLYNEDTDYVIVGSANDYLQFEI
jgi:hypothetical protein